jgi:hypothetical protein
VRNIGKEDVPHDNLGELFKIVKTRAKIVMPFLLGFLVFVRIPVVGALALNEILLFVMAPFYLNRARRVVQFRAFRSIFLLGLAYLFSLIAADLYRETPAQDYLRGWAKIGITLCSFLFLIPILSANRQGLLFFLIGWFLSPLASIITYGVQWELYKFYIGAPISAASFLAVGYAARYLKKAGHFLPLLASCVAILQNCRALAGITLIALIGDWLVARRNRLQSSGKNYTTLIKMRLIFRFLLFCLAGFGIMELYNYVAPRGYLGEWPLKTYEMQTRLSPSGKFTFLTGRWDALYTWPKIFESPVIGYGSWPKDIDYVVSRARELGMDPVAVAIPGEYELIPAHSHISGGWLEAGIFGGIFWIIALVRAVRTLVNGSTAFIGQLAPLMTFLLVFFAWDLIFSPYGAERRLWNGFMLAWIAWAETQMHHMRTSYAIRNDVKEPALAVEKKLC